MQVLIAALLAAASDAPVDQLSLRQLEAEELRLAEPPSLAPSGVLLGLGGACTTVALVLAGSLLESTYSPHPVTTLGESFARAASQLVVTWVASGLGIVGVLLGLTGGGLMQSTYNEREARAERQRQVHVRRVTLHADPPQLPTFQQSFTP